jgi:cyanophycinase
MVLCEHYYDPHESKLLEGLKLLPHSCILPHHNSFGRNWAGRLAAQLPGETLVGIDERTGILNEISGTWTVYGAGKVTLYRDSQTEIYARSETLHIFKDPSSH